MCTIVSVSDWETPMKLEQFLSWLSLRLSIHAEYRPVFRRSKTAEIIESTVRAHVAARAGQHPESQQLPLAEKTVASTSHRTAHRTVEQHSAECTGGGSAGYARQYASALNNESRTHTASADCHLPVADRQSDGPANPRRA